MASMRSNSYANDKKYVNNDVSKDLPKSKSAFLVALR